MICATLRVFEREFCIEDTGVGRTKSLTDIIRDNYLNAYSLADQWGKLLRNFFETGEGMTQDQAIQISANIAHLLQGGNDSYEICEKIGGQNLMGLKSRTLRELIEINFGNENKIAAIKTTREMTTMGLLEAKNFYELVESERKSGRLLKEDFS